MTTPSLQSALAAHAAQTSLRISRAEVGGQFYWVKHEEQLTMRRRLQKGDAHSAFQAELEAYHRLADLDLPVPPIVAQGPDFFALPDAGTPLSHVLMDETTSATERRAVCGAAADGLWAFHAKGVSHGRPSLKDILWNGSSVQFIDFERFSEARNTARGHAEDLVMLVFNAFAVTGEPRDEIRHMVDTYRGHAPEEIWELAQDWCRKRRWLDWATKPIQMRRPGKAKEFKAIPLTLAAFA